MADDRSERFTLSRTEGLAVVRRSVPVNSLDLGRDVEGDTRVLVRTAEGRVTGTYGRAAPPSRLSSGLTGTKGDRKWHLIDADGLVVGRAATIIAHILRGKHKAGFTPHVDCGDNVVVINADKIRLSGKKLGQKVYYKHTGYAGGAKGITAARGLERQFPERVLAKAVERMIPSGPLGREQLRHLRIFTGADHSFENEHPELLDIDRIGKKARP